MDTPTTSRIQPSFPWDSLPAAEWNADAARHLLRRTGWTATPQEVERAVADGLQATLDRLFPATFPTFPKPALLSRMEQQLVDLALRARAAPEMEKRQLRRELRDKSQQAQQDLVLRWLEFARQPSTSASEKWVLFLSDIYVVSYEKVRNPLLLWDHQAILRTHGSGPAPALTKAVTRSPAMVEYLDLKDSKRTAPNENFARELFELFVLGEGNYTESDIKEAARAFTGYRQRFGKFQLARAQHDSSAKTVFGKTRNFSGDDVVDLAYDQPAAATFLPRELWRFYVSTVPLPDAELSQLGAWWRGKGFDLRALQHRVFSSRRFFAAENQGNFIKSPLQFYLGALQDLDLEVTPLARQVIGVLRLMGQNPFNPPNVRGWVGGRNWISSTTLAARRQLTQALFNPLAEDKLNADDLVELAAARSAGRTRFTVTRDDLPALADKDSKLAARKLLTRLSLPTGSAYETSLAEFLSSTTPDKIREAAMALLQSPEYQLC